TPTRTMVDETDAPLQRPEQVDELVECVAARRDQSGRELHEQDEIGIIPKHLLHAGQHEILGTLDVHLDEVYPLTRRAITLVQRGRLHTNGRRHRRRTGNPVVAAIRRVQVQSDLARPIGNRKVERLDIAQSAGANVAAQQGEILGRRFVGVYASRGAGAPREFQRVKTDVGTDVNDGHAGCYEGAQQLQLV